MHGNEITRTQLEFFENRVRPLLSAHCFQCHGEDDQSGSLRLDRFDHLMSGGDSGPVVVPGRPDESILIEAVRYEGYEMPPGEQLSDEQIDVLVRWVEMGVPWPGQDPNRPVRKRELFDESDRSWWAIQPIQEPAIPSPPSDAQSNEIDAFLNVKMLEAGLVPGPRMADGQLIRRLYLDTVGVPPSPQEVDAFASNTASESYSVLVDRVLEDSRFGEHMARFWLDLVRYAESDGYRADEYRPDAWRYRDYVIRSFNEDKPYDRFLQEQLAADELFPEDLDAQIGLGFLRHWVYEWNIRDARTQWKTIVEDITDTTADAFLGLGLQCAKCHNHKFDPLLQKDYFALRAFFEPIIPTATPLANRSDAYADQWENWNTQTREIRDRIDDVLRPYKEKYRDIAIGRFPDDLREVARMSTQERTPHQEQLAYLIYRQVNAEYDRLDRNIDGDDKEKLVALRRELARFDSLKPAPVPTAMTVTDIASVSSPTRIPKGRREVVRPASPTILGGDPIELESMRTRPENYVVINTSVEDPVEVRERPLSERASAEVGVTTGRRAALARWMTRSDNPLVARVIVNRIWQQYFGRGLAENPSDFGILGGPPSHPELLDWLASRLISNGWSLKSIHRLILHSQAYARSTRHADFESHQAIDPQNSLYWRRTPQRLTAEQIRDCLLSVTGQLKPIAGGPSTHADERRRSIYLRVNRNSADPLLQAFDLPRRFASTSGRNTTTTPLQSLLLFNSDHVLDFAKALTDVAFEKKAPTDDRIEAVWKRVYGREIDAEELNESRQFLSNQAKLLGAKSDGSRFDSIATAGLPNRDGRALAFLDDSKPTLSIPHGASLDNRDFTIEAFFQIRSVAKSGTVRTILSKTSSKDRRQGWKFGVTGRGSRRKPQTLVLQLFGETTDGRRGEAALFSDHHVDLDKPYYAAVSFRHATHDEAGQVMFYLKDISNDDEPLLTAKLDHEMVCNYQSEFPLRLGATDGQTESRFDGLIDDVRVSSRSLELEELLFSGEDRAEGVIAYWQFEPDPGLLKSS
ncbi:MAG: DUF1553 domain-containing protein, partial [Planctomycetota bacterium]